MKNLQILITVTLKQKYIKWIHSGHQEINTCLKKVIEFVFWVRCMQDIQEAMEKCVLCQYSLKLSSEKFKYFYDIPPHPWYTVALDPFYHKKMDFLKLVAYFSNFWLLEKLLIIPDKQ